MEEEKMEFNKVTFTAEGNLLLCWRVTKEREKVAAAARVVRKKRKVLAMLFD
jgi:hypothetical protein